MSDEELQVLKELNEREKREEQKREAMIASNRKTAKGCLIAFSVLCIGFAATCALIVREMDSPESQAAIEDIARCGTESAAFVYSKDFVKERLRSPSTAEFPPYSGAEGVEIEKMECGRYEVHAYVDASNAFGAPIRNRYSALMMYDPDEEVWRGEVVIVED